MNHTAFAVSRFENRNGVISWRIAGLLHGVRIRRNFKTKEEAAAEKAALELKAAQADSGLRSAFTFLTDGELRQAEDAFRRLEGHSRSMLFYLDYALANYREQQDKPLPDAVTEYLAEKTKQHQRTLLSQPQLRNITNELKVLKKWFPAGMMEKLTPSLLLTYLERGKPSLKTYNNRRAILSTFFKFALQQEWITGTPVEKTPYHRIKHRRGSATTITAICVLMPQRCQVERRYINTLLKLVYYTHALQRYDKSDKERAGDNLLILWADEAQRIVTASSDGMSDHNVVDVIREARATIVAATQSYTSLIPPMGDEQKAKVLIANLANRITFCAADEDSAKIAADTLGKYEGKRRTVGYSGGQGSSSWTKESIYFVEPHELRKLRKFHAVGGVYRLGLAGEGGVTTCQRVWPCLLTQKEQRDCSVDHLVKGADLGERVVVVGHEANRLAPAKLHQGL